MRGRHSTRTLTRARVPLLPVCGCGTIYRPTYDKPSTTDNLNDNRKHCCLWVNWLFAYFCLKKTLTYLLTYLFTCRGKDEARAGGISSQSEWSHQQQQQAEKAQKCMVPAQAPQRSLSAKKPPRQAPVCGQHVKTVPPRRYLSAPPRRVCGLVPKYTLRRRRRRHIKFIVVSNNPCSNCAVSRNNLSLLYFK